jgi:large subunit ribosomal protein L2
MRHQGSGNKKVYRIVDFLQNKIDVPGRVETIEYDPYRSGFISLVVYKDGERRYVLAPKDLKVGEEIVVSAKAPLKPGNRVKIKNVPVGYFVHNVEIRSGGGGRLARSAGSYAEVLAHEAGLTDLRMSSKEIRKVSSEAWASIGQVSNPDYNLVNIGKAGRSRWLGIRPTVRGSAMNPVDHPYGGGEGAQPRGTKRPKTIWGKVTGGHKTRHPKKWSSKWIVQRRPKVR